MTANIHKRKYLPTPSTSSEEYDPKTESMTIEEFSRGKDQWRVSAAGHLPVHYPYNFFNSGGFPKIIGKMKLWPRDEPSAAVDTVIIRTNQGDDDKDRFTRWQDACGEILDLLVKKGNLDSSQVQVEIVNPARTNQDESSGIRDTTVRAAIDSVRDALYNIAKAHLGGHLRQISWHMRGPRDAPEEALRPTAMVFVRKRSFLRFTYAQKSIAEALLTPTFPGVFIDLEIVRGGVELC
ncbi:uncharacterized protein LY89DRAFT_733423 [Mollisia scopiformis]|uniref:Uncharacterized protein n=1 Tax=Mollisia scopiformis TaxID=149040 RepID=A0A194XBP9_MOLSC|nr:uncharacterized protein LY89DRAFT_733423 [Mollisia scopiformis]KUJ17583.1 hypothetical protein LY89DRAFT_733423 [Mollisia scopiformis]